MSIHLDIRAAVAGSGRTFELDAAFASHTAFTVLYGPSGSGKSLTLRCIAGLLTPRHGSITVRGNTLFDSTCGVDAPARHRYVGYLFQDYALFPHLSAEQNVGFGLRGWPFGGLSQPDRDRVRDIMASFELDRLAACRPHELSGGQRQRVALARALAARPELLLLDEPFSALDHALRDRMRRYIRRACAQFGVPAIIVTHDPADVDSFGETVVRYEPGLGQADGRACMRDACAQAAPGTLAVGGI